MKNLSSYCWWYCEITKGELPPSSSLSLQEIHLVRCLTHISHRYFSPGRSVVISSPSTYRDVQQELIAEIHWTAIWSVVVTVDGNISKHTKTGFIDRDGSYIILIPDGNLNNFKAEINGLAGGQNLSFTRFWNSEARFFVAGTNEFSMSQQSDIFDFFSKFRIYNCSIVSQEHYIKDKEYSKSWKIMMQTQPWNWECTLCFPIRVQTVVLRWMISPYWTVGLFLHKGTSPRTLTCFLERSVRASTDVL